MHQLLKNEYFSKSQIGWFGCGGIVLCLITYLSHLGTLPVDVTTDEGRRVLVTAEMMISGDYITPTLNGELFLNKPPLYNWWMACWIKIGGFHPFWMRMPVIVAIVGFGFFIFFMVKRYTNASIALVSAFAFVTNGRILIYDSLLSFIDLTFALVMYAQMMLVFHFGHQKKYWQLFLITYCLTALGFLMKGLPAFAFQAITLLVYFIYSKRFVLLFSIQHIVGILLLSAMLGGYYFAYFTANQITPTLLFTRLLTESTDRTVVKFGIVETIWHFLYYPVEMMYHYAPWLLLLLLLIRKKIITQINENPFIQFNAWIFLCNFILYWTSPQVYARYLFPLLPMLITVLVYLFYTHTTAKNWNRLLPEWIFGGLLALVTIACFVVPFLPLAAAVHVGWLKGIVCGIVLAAITFNYFTHPTTRLPWLGIGLFTVRLFFNWFVIDQRGEPLRQSVTDAHKIVSMVGNQPLFIQKGANVGNLDGLSFHITTMRNEILRYDSTFQKGSWYITDSSKMKLNSKIGYTFHNHLAPERLYLVKYGSE